MPLEPLQPPLALQLLASVELQLSVVAAPLLRFAEALVRRTLGAGADPGTAGVAGVDGVVGAGTAGVVVAGVVGGGAGVPRVGDLVSATENGPWVTGAERSLELPEQPPSSRIEHSVVVQMRFRLDIVDLCGTQLTRPRKGPGR
ncbi:MAG: hypothetical protein R3E82_07040 [Pseudomonadales bacterium]